MLSALHTELLLQKDYLSGSEIETIYFGGGTPSLLKSEEIQSLIDDIKALFPVIIKPEITLEANPDDLDQESLRKLRQTDVNRFSIRITIFF